MYFSDEANSGREENAIIFLSDKRQEECPGI